LEPLDTIVGQSRAIEAIHLGSELMSKGYNIFVSGLAGTGRLSTVKMILDKLNKRHPTLFDFCYVNNFANPDQPSLIKLPQGNGKKFAHAIDDSVTFLRRRLPKLFEEENFQRTRRTIIENFQNKEKEILGQFDKKIEPFGFIRGQLENDQGVSQPEVFPLLHEKPFQIEDIDDLVSSRKLGKRKASEIRSLYKEFHNELLDLAQKGMKLMKDFRNEIEDNDKTAASIQVNSIFDEIKTQFPDEKVEIFIEEIKKYILDNLHVFVPSENQPVKIVENDEESKETDKFSVFTVNVILDNSTTTSAPVIVETTPSFNNLFGTIERVYDNRGFWRTDFTKIKAGGLLKADQGYLIVNASDLFAEPEVWNALKRVLLYDKLEIQSWDSFFNVSQSYIKPEPINVNVKVIIIGGQTLYTMLYLYEKGFKKIFKVNAQFDYEIERTDDMLNSYARFIAKICREENLPHCNPDGVGAIIEWALEHGGSQKRITLKFSDVADLVREAAFYGRESKKKLIDRKDVSKAIEWRRMRNDLLDDKLKYQIIEGNILIDTEGARVGQINGLTVYDTGLVSFGKPVRITATVSAGTSGIINIEREADLSGSIHNKGVLINHGYLREKFATKHPMSLTASIAFEQSYGGIDGDSASAAEIYILLSALANVPINQFYAVTGSVNQKGDIQPIGGVNDKIRGFFEICRDRGFSGRQGVIIPEQNVSDLMLCHEIIKAVKEKKFHIYSISKVEDGIPLLMNIEAGQLDKDGNYPKGTLFEKVVKKLEFLHESSKEDFDEEKKKPRKKKKIEEDEEDEE
jgi:lon-related putative ATP-dependent protease